MNEQLKKLLLDAAKLSQIGEKKMQDFIDQKTTTDAAGTHTGNTGAGEEAMKAITYKSELYSMIVSEGDLFSRLPGNHGQIEGLSAQVTIKGLPQLMASGSETTTHAANGATRNGIVTDKIVLAPKKFTDSFYMSYEAIKGFTDPQGLYNYIIGLCKANMQWTALAYIMNGDDQSNTATGNVNHKDAGTPVAFDATAYYNHTGASGIVKTAIANGLVSESTPAALARTLLKKLRLKVGDYADAVQDLLWIASGKAKVEMAYLDTYSSIDKFGQKATNQTGIVERVEGIDLYSSRYFMKKVDADGYVRQGSTADASNLYTGLSLVYAPAVQYAFGHDPIIVSTADENGIRVGYSMWFDSQIINEKAGLDKTVAGAVITTG